MRLLTATHYFESHRGGIELVAGRLAREFAAAGAEVTWMAGAPSPPPATEPRLSAVPLPVWNGVERRLGVPFPVPGPKALARILRAVRKADAVLLHDALYLTNVLTFFAARAFARPVLVVQHIGAVPYRNPALRLLMELANRLVARPLLAGADQAAFISETTRRYFASVRFRHPPVLVFNGVDTELFTLAGEGEKTALRARLGLPLDTHVALFVGRFVEKKGLAFLEAAARARPDVVWAFAGWGPLDPDAWRLPNVRVFRQMDQHALAELYRSADALVLPSIGEGFPLVVQEALACGLPVICGAETAQADPAAAPHLVGLSLDSDDPANTAHAIGAAFDHALAAPSAGAARARFAAERYAWRRAAARYLELFDEARGAPEAAVGGAAR